MGNSRVLRRVTAPWEPGTGSRPVWMKLREPQAEPWEVRAGRAASEAAGLLQARISSVDFALSAMGSY